ncbi:phd-finger domain-containing protein, partial [Cystoisospora suis]
MGDPVEQWLEDCLTLPGKLHRALRLMAQLEQDAMRTEDQFQTLEKQFLTRLRHCYQQGSTWPAEEQSEEIHTIKTLHSKCRALLREKVVVNKQIASFIHYEQQRLARERDKLLHSMSGLGAAATQAQGGGVDTGVPGGVNAPGGSSSSGAGPSGGNSQAVGGSSSAGGSTAGRSTLRRRGNDRGDSRGGSSVGGSGSLERSGSDAVSGGLAAGGLVGPERSVASMVVGVGRAVENEGEFLLCRDRLTANDVQAGALSGGSSTTSVRGTGRSSHPGGSSVAAGVCPPSAGSDVSVGSSTVPPSKKAR